MREILGDNLEKAIQNFNVNATKTYQSNSESTDFRQVWEMTDEEYEKLCNVPDNEWNIDGWWRGALGSNMGIVTKRYNINNHYIMAWDGYKREEWEEENRGLPVEDKWFKPRKYCNLLEYFCEELGASTESNVCALSVDLAQQNNMKMSELFKKYQLKEK